MPAKAPAISNDVKKKIATLGKQIRQRRKALGVNATTTAQAGNMSRVTLYRIENGEPSVTIGAYLNALDALGMDFGITTSNQKADSNMAGWIPARINLADYPQLRQIAWQLHVTELAPTEALSIYERNWRHLDLEQMEPTERQLIDALQLAFGQSTVHV